MGSASAGVGSALPSQDGFSGYVLTTDGVTPSWEPSSASLPSQVGNSGKYLTTNGTAAAWGAITADGLLPSQTGKNGDVLGTNGTTVAWVSASGITLAAVGSTPNANGMTLTGSALNLEPADATNPGIVTTGAQSWAGDKTIGSLVVAAAGYLNMGSAYVDLRNGNIILFSGPSATVVNFNIDSAVRFSCSATSLDMTGMGAGGSIKLKSPDGTTYTATIANGGTWSIA